MKAEMLGRIAADLLSESERDWDEVLRSDDSERGGKLATFVVHMARNTELGFESISSYLWGIRTWFKEQRQADPVMGILGWQDLGTMYGSSLSTQRCMHRSASSAFALSSSSSLSCSSTVISMISCDLVEWVLR